jgi:hypothetical protein
MERAAGFGVTSTPDPQLLLPRKDFRTDMNPSAAHLPVKDLVCIVILMERKSKNERLDQSRPEILSRVLGPGDPSTER